MLTKTLPQAAAPAPVKTPVGSQGVRRNAPTMRFDGTRVSTGRGCASTYGLAAAVISNVPGDPLWSPPV